MAKDPALLWYPSDWISGTHGMTLEEKGAYMELLMMQFNRGHLTTDMVTRVVGQVWGQIQHKFLVDENGLWYNERLDMEKDKRKSFTISRNNNLQGKNQYSKNGHTTSRMENVNRNGNTIVYGKSFCENFELVFFPDGSSQQLGVEQKILSSQGNLSAKAIVKGVSY
jgi:uncharacterized protein YdaU (DUF1376 family)